MNMDEVNVEEGFKICSKCGEILPLSEFSKCKSSKDGLQYWCKDCQKALKKEYYQNHRENELKKRAEWRAKNPTYNAEYHQANKEKKAAYNAEYYDPQKNPRGWAKRMVNHYRKMDKERGFDTSQTITADWFLDNIAYRPCVYCGVQAIGLIACNRLDNTKGHTIDNVESCCFKCNARENIRDQIARGLHWTCKHKKQSFKDFVNEHKAKDKNLS